MDLSLAAIALGDVTWLTLAFALGFVANRFGLPPLVGFLAAGFLLAPLGGSGGDLLQKLADLGITLLLFTIGLKLQLSTLLRPHIWAATTLHTVLITLVMAGLLLLFSLTGLPLISELDAKLALLIAFALSFSSTVFVVKVLESRGEMKSLHGGVAIGVLVMQDIFAVLFVAASMGKVPSVWAGLLLLLIPGRHLLYRLLERTGHGELIILFGLVMALGGATLFEAVSLKGDLGALLLGALLAGHPKSKELATAMLNFKDLFLVGFFLSIGFSVTLTAETFVLGALLVLFVPLKSFLFFVLFTGFRLRARTSMMATINLSNFSEFGLIVAALCVSQGWLAPEWLVVVAVAVSVSFVVSAPINSRINYIYRRYASSLRRFQKNNRLPDDELLDTLGASIAVFGMGRVGTSTYDRMRELHGETVVGIDFDRERVLNHREEGRLILQGDPADPDFWDKLDRNHRIALIMLTLPTLDANLRALTNLREMNYEGEIVATAKYPDEQERLLEAGVSSVYNIYQEVGTGFADHVVGVVPVPSQ